MKISFGDTCYPTIKFHPVPLVGSTMGGRMDFRVLKWGHEK